jgi:hypothetical protein
MTIFAKLQQLIEALQSQDAHKEATQVGEIVKVANKIIDKVKARFWKKVQKKECGCWEWTGSTGNGGHGLFRIGDKLFLTHKLALLWSGRKIPTGAVIRHLCNNPLCCRISHLLIGSVQENVRDRVKGDRSAKGQNNGKAILKNKDIQKIRRLKERGLSETEIGIIFGVSRSAINHILNSRSWNWLDDGEEKK